jgi:hypothetical protein
VPSGPAQDPDRKHLHIVLTDRIAIDANGPADFVIVVSVCSVVEGVPHDPACILNVGDHEFIRHPSYVYYGMMTAVNVEELERQVAAGIINVLAPVSEGLFALVAAGLFMSRHARPRWRGLVRHALNQADAG